MKNAISRSIALCGAVLLTITLAHGVANAQCADYVFPSQGGGYSCEFSHESGGYCYYECDCGSLSEQQCNDNLHKDGFEIEGIDY